MKTTASTVDATRLGRSAVGNAVVGSELHFLPEQSAGFVRRTPVRAAIFFFAVLIAAGLGSGIRELSESLVVETISAVVGIGLAVGAYLLLVRFVEQRTAEELGIRGAGAELGLGFAIGGVLLGVTVLILWLAGMAEFSTAGTWGDLYRGLLLALVAGIVEEVLIRGVVFRMLEESLGSVIALVLSAAIFGALHATNTNATLWSSTAIAIEAGILLGAAYMLTRRLWMAIGIHIAWNFFQGGLFGLPVSGEPSDGLLVGTLSGNKWLSGGDFGVEASLLVVGLCLLVSATFLQRVINRGGIVQPGWRRSS